MPSIFHPRSLKPSLTLVLLVLIGLSPWRPAAAEEVTLNFSDADLTAVANSVS